MFAEVNESLMENMTLRMLEKQKLYRDWKEREDENVPFNFFDQFDLPAENLFAINQIFEYIKRIFDIVELAYSSWNFISKNKMQSASIEIWQII